MDDGERVQELEQPTVETTTEAEAETAGEEKEIKPQPGAFMTPEKLLRTLKKMVEKETISAHQARQMRRQFGISQAYFTGKKVSFEEKKAKKKTADASRRKNRGRG